MRATSFFTEQQERENNSEQIISLGAPVGHENRVDRLVVMRTPESVVSYWEPTQEELHMLAEGGKVRLSIMGQGMPPVRVDVAF